MRHDEGMMQAMDNLLDGLTGGADEKEVAHQVASLPMRLGGLGLRSARRMAAGAYWSSWADALATTTSDFLRVANRITDRLEGVAAARGCLTELREAADRLDRQGFVGRPGWGELKLGARPPPAHTVEQGEWAHGWQYHASSVSEYPSGRRWCFPSQVRPTRPTFVLTLEEDLPMCSTDAPQAQNSQWRPRCFAL